jgi:hypothetical protein
MTTAWREGEPPAEGLYNVWDGNDVFSAHWRAYSASWEDDEGQRYYHPTKAWAPLPDPPLEPAVDGFQIAWAGVDPAKLGLPNPAVGRTGGSYVADPEPDLCPSCAARMAEARVEGKLGIVMCGDCVRRRGPAVDDWRHDDCEVCEAARAAWR